jgi:hypothetical protein
VISFPKTILFLHSHPSNPPFSLKMFARLSALASARYNFHFLFIPTLLPLFQMTLSGTNVALIRPRRPLSEPFGRKLKYSDVHTNGNGLFQWIMNGIAWIWCKLVKLFAVVTFYTKRRQRFGNFLI